MKFIKYILFLFILVIVSCKSKIPNTPAPPPSASAPKDSDRDSDRDRDGDRDGVPDYQDIILVSAPRSHSKPIVPKPIVPKSQRNVENKSVDIDLNGPEVIKVEPRPKGLIAYSVPTEMQVGKEYSVKVRISKKNDKTVLVVGDREIPISDDVSSVKIESISVSPIMSASLLSQKGNFEITSLSTEIQNIDEEGYTEWAWVVTPLVGGQNNLKLNIKIRIKENGETSYKDITVFEKKIKVKSNIGFSIKEFFSKNWEWFMGAILIPIIQWLWGFWRKRKEEEKKDVN